MNKLINLVKNEEGQGMTEYAIVLGVIAVGAITALVAFGDNISTFISGITSGITDELNK